HEGDTVVYTLLEQSPADQNGHAAATFLEVLLFIWSHATDPLHLCKGARVALLPFHWRQVSPAHVTSEEIFTAVSDHPEKGLIRLDDFTGEIPDEDPHNICVD